MFIKTLRSLANYDITNLASELKIKYFKGVFMRDTLPIKINNKLHNKFIKNFILIKHNYKLY